MKHPLAPIEPRLRWLLPADLYAAAWVQPTAANLQRVFEHQRTLQSNLLDYLPRLVTENPPKPGAIRYGWQEGTLMFTDLAGFTPLLEANAARGQAGAEALLGLLNSYFANMLEIIGKSGGDLLEFTGDALLIQFPADGRGGDVLRAVRAGLRMQRAMAAYASIATDQGELALGMRVGIHRGRFLAADVGTPRRMEYVMLGQAVQATKHAEGSGVVGRVCLTEPVYAVVRDYLRCERRDDEHWLVVDDLGQAGLGEFDIPPVRRRAARPVILDRSVEGLVGSISEMLERTEAMASYLPFPVLTVLVESAIRRKIRAEFPELTVIFVNLLGASAAVDQLAPGEEGALVESFSRAFALVNAAVEARGGVLKNVTYDRVGSDVLIYFGAPNAHTDDAKRAVATALAIREAINGDPQVRRAVAGCQIGIARGPAFAAEVGEARGRREFNVLGDTVNTAARLMSRAEAGQILLNDAVRNALAGAYEPGSLGLMALKGKAQPMAIFGL
jgi:adenylate cyclase